MSSVNITENYKGRVDYACKVIALNGNKTRTFDSCFENHDGDEVAVAVLRRAEKNPKIQANVFKYLDEKYCTDIAEKLKDIPTKELAIHAQNSREKAKKDFKEFLEMQKK